MKNVLQHPDFGQIRTQKQGDNYLFCAKDVCDALNINNNRDALKNLDEDEKGVAKIYTPGGYQEMLFVTESGLYALIIRSNKPNARKFRKWITAEVLPNLRKYGTYSTDEKIMQRAKQRYEQKAKKELFREIDKKLSTTDKRLIAKQCLSSEYEVNRVLNVEKEDVYMATLLYNRAIGNQELHSEFYTAKGAENLLKTLLSKTLQKL